MKDPEIRARADKLMGISFDSRKAQERAAELGDRLKAIFFPLQDPHEAFFLGQKNGIGIETKRALAERELKNLAEKRVALGWYWLRCEPFPASEPLCRTVP